MPGNAARTPAYGLRRYDGIQAAYDLRHRQAGPQHAGFGR